MTPETERELRLRTLAGAAERRNRPARLLYISGAIVLIAVVFAAVNLRAAAQVRERLAAQIEQHTEIMRVAEQIEAIRAREQRQDLARKYPPEPQLLGKLEQIHQRLGMERGPSLNELSRRTLGLDSPFYARNVRASFTDTPLSKVMEWLNEALVEVRDLRVTSVDFRPTSRGWVVTVEFTKWEFES